MLIACQIYPTISRLEYSITGHHKLFEDLIVDFSVNLHGLLNFYFYGCDPRIWKKLRENEKKEKEQYFYNNY